SAVLSGQAKTENGISHDENQVSKTSGSRTSSCDAHSAQATGSGPPGFGTVTCAFPQYHAGISCPHQSWREMHQSRMFLIHSSNVFFHVSGVKRTSRRSAALEAFSASGLMRTNHWSETSGSSTVSQR